MQFMCSVLSVLLPQLNALQAHLSLATVIPTQFISPDEHLLFSEVPETAEHTAALHADAVEESDAHCSTKQFDFAVSVVSDAHEF